MNIRKLKKFFNYNIFYSLLILLLVISFTFQNIAIAQNTNQQQSNNTNEHFSLVLALDPEGEAKVNYTFQQGNLLAIVYGKSNLKVIDLDSNNIVYEISSSKSNILLPCLVDNYLLYYLSGQKETIRVDLSITEKEGIGFPGSSYQITDDGYLITHYGNLCQLIDLDDGQVLFKPDVSKSGRGKILCVDDLIIFPFDDNHGNSAGYKAMSTSEEVKFTLEESFNEVRIFLPEYRSKISTFPLPILICSNYNNPDEKQWLLNFINKEGQTIASYSPADLDIDYSWNRVNSPLWVLDENQDNFLLEIRSSKNKYYYILTDLSGNVLQIFDETSNCTAAIDSQGNILLHQVGGTSNVLNYYQQDGTPIFNKQIPCLLEVNALKRFKFLSENEILEWEYGGFEKYSLTNGELTGIYPISTDYQIYTSHTVVFGDQVYFFARPRGGHEPPIPGSNLFSFSTADSGWLNIELVSIKPNAGTIYEVYNNTDVRVKFKTEYGSNFGKNLTVNFEKGTASATNNNLEYIWHTPIILNGNEDTSKISVSCGPASKIFVINIINPHPPTAAFEFSPSFPETGELVDFVSKSFDIGGRILSYHWDFGDETEEVEKWESTVYHTFPTAGKYPVTLTVTDNQGGTAQISQNIEIVEVAEVIETSLQVKVLDEGMPLEGVKVTLSKSTDTDFITQGDLTTKADGTCEFLNLEVGDYRVLLDLDQEEGYIPPGIREVTLAEGANSVEINVEPSKGFGVAFFKNAPPGPLGRAVPEGHPNPSKSEWRPIWVSEKLTFNMPQSQYFHMQDSIKQEDYTSSASSWKSSLPSTTLFSNNQYIKKKGPSTIWRRYDLTLFEEVNGAPIVVPVDISSDPYYQHQNPYAFTGTLSANELPSNWYLDPWKRWLVENAMSGGLPDIGNWGLFDSMATLFEGTTVAASAALGPAGVLIYMGLLAIEYWTIFEYEQLVISMEEDYQKYLQSSLKNTPTPNDYFSIYNASLGKPTIVRRDVPNYQKIWNVKSRSWESYISPDYTNASNTSSSERDNPIGGFTIQARTTEINAPQLQPGTTSRVVAINKAFTSASIPFQFVLRVNTDGGDYATAQVKGHFFVRLHLPSITGDSSRPDRWVKLDVAGIKNDQWLSPWELIRTTIDMQTYMRCTTTNQGGDREHYDFPFRKWCPGSTAGMGR